MVVGPAAEVMDRLAPPSLLIAIRSRHVWATNNVALGKSVPIIGLLLTHQELGELMVV